MATDKALATLTRNDTARAKLPVWNRGRKQMGAWSATWDTVTIQNVAAKTVAVTDESGGRHVIDKQNVAPLPTEGSVFYADGNDRAPAIRWQSFRVGDTWARIGVMVCIDGTLGIAIEEIEGDVTIAAEGRRIHPAPTSDVDTSTPGEGICHTCGDEADDVAGVSTILYECGACRGVREREEV